MKKPTEWSDATVGELTHRIIGGGTPSRKVAEYFGGEIPWATVKDMSGDAFFKSDTIEHITKEAVKESASNLIDAESIIIATRMGIGRGFINTKPMAINQDLKALEIDKERVDAYFFLYWYIYSGNLLAAKGGGSTVQGITLDDLRAFPISLPTKSEQTKIAKIVSSIDSAIENNNSLLNKLTDLKKALMQELFTKGIGHKEFKESSLGRIPDKWEISLCNDVAKMGTGHTPSKSYPEYYNGGIKWVSLADSDKLDNVYIKRTKYEISSLGIQNSSAVLHPAGTLLISRDAGVGKSAIMESDMAVSQHFITYSCSKKLSNLFLYYLFQYRKHEFERIAIGSTIKTIGLPYFKSLMIVLPPISEQDQISKTLLSVDSRMWSCQSKLSSLSNLKTALMQVLLSGKVRVNA